MVTNYNSLDYYYKVKVSRDLEDCTVYLEQVMEIIETASSSTLHPLSWQQRMCVYVQSIDNVLSRALAQQ